MSLCNEDAELSSILCGLKEAVLLFRGEHPPLLQFLMIAKWENIFRYIFCSHIYLNIFWSLTLCPLTSVQVKYYSVMAYWKFLGVKCRDIKIYTEGYVAH